MDNFDYTKKFNIQKKIDNFAKKYKNKKVVLYGAGQFAQYLFENYDFSKLNIVAIADKKYENTENELFNNIPCIEPIKIKELNVDFILITALLCTKIINYLNAFVFEEDTTTKVDWILKQNILDYIKNKIRYGKPKKKPVGKYIFTFWEPKEKMPAYIKLCLKTWKKFLPDYKIVVLDYTNLEDWLGFEFFDDYLYKNFSLPMQTDAIRIVLLYKYGGIWLDADTIITSDKIRDILESSFDVVMIKTHLAFIKARKKAKLIKIWLHHIKKKLLMHKFYHCFGNVLKYILSIKSFVEMEGWNYFGNSIIDSLSKKYNGHSFMSLNRDELYAFPENNYFPSEDVPRNNKYIDFYFKNDFSEYIFENTKGIILLHNSWTPLIYKKMSEEEFLNQNNTLSKILLKLVGEKDGFSS